MASVFEFVYYVSLLDGDVRIRSNFRKHLRDGAAYMAFRIASFFVLATLLIAMFAAPSVSLVAVPLVALPAAVALLVLSVLFGLVNNFVLPGMIINGSGFLTALKEAAGKDRQEWKQIGVYVLIRFAVKIGLATAVGATVFALLIPFAVVLAIASLLPSFVTAVIAVVLLAMIFVAGLGVSIPISVFMRYYALDFYQRL